MRKTTRAERNAISVEPQKMEGFAQERAPWVETQEEVEAALAWGEEKAVLLRWVRRQMGRRLKPHERRCLELYYFDGMSCRQAASQTGLSAASVSRIVRRCINKLQVAAEEDESWQRQLRRLGRKRSRYGRD